MNFQDLGQIASYRALETYLNAIIASDPLHGRLLAQHEGLAFSLKVSPFPGDYELRIRQGQFYGREVPSGTSQFYVQGPLRYLHRLFRVEISPWQVHGDLQVWEAFHQSLQKFVVDEIYWVEKALGRVAAHMVRQFKAKQKEYGQHHKTMAFKAVEEYLVHELRLLPSRQGWRSLEARIAQLEEKLAHV